MTTNKKARRVASPSINQILTNASPVKRTQNQNRIEIACRIDDLIKEKGYKNYTAFACKMGRQPAELSKWLSGTHNFTLDTLSEIAFHLEIPFAHLLQEQKVQVVYQTKYEVVVPQITIQNNPFNNYTDIKQNSYIGSVNYYGIKLPIQTSLNN